MSKPRPSQPMPPGLKSQIAFAIFLTTFAIVVLPSALSAAKTESAPRPAVLKPSAGTITTTTRTFVTQRFKATSFTDWD